MASPFRAHMEKLLAGIDGAVSCVLMDFDGIAVDTASKSDAPSGDMPDVQTLSMEFAHLIAQARRTLESVQAGRSPAETCWRYHHLIGEDLRTLGVVLDEWISPLDEVHAQPYRELHEDLVCTLAERGTAQKATNPTPRSSGSGRYVIGVWLLGVCPQCHSPSCGNACEECGYHYQPSEILQPQSRLDDSSS